VLVVPTLAASASTPAIVAAATLFSLRNLARDLIRFSTRPALSARTALGLGLTVQLQCDYSAVTTGLQRVLPARSLVSASFLAFALTREAASARADISPSHDMDSLGVPRWRLLLSLKLSKACEKLTSAGRVVHTHGVRVRDEGLSMQGWR